MRDDPPVAQMLEIAGSTGPLLERARALVECLDRWLHVDAIWLTLSDPGCNVYATVGSTGLERPVRDYLEHPEAAWEIPLAELDPDRPPVSVTELPGVVDGLPTWADCLIPAGFRGGVGVPLCEPGGAYLGMLSLLLARGESLSAGLQGRVGQLAPLIARGVSPIRSSLASARLVEGATSGVVLFRDGATHPLPGLADHPLLAAGSRAVEVARQALLAGGEYRSFMWPAVEGPGISGHARMTVLAANGVPRFVLGTLLMRPEGNCRGLTPRELEVLGHLVEGRSNQQIARRLDVASRTVATHMEHIMHKLKVPTRTLAAVQAEREGCHVPPLPGSAPTPRLPTAAMQSTNL